MARLGDRVDSIRDMMRSRGWDAVILTGNDPHASEYSASRWHQVAWVSGYTGEGDLVITEDHAGLWTDSRYFIQAERQLRGTGIELHKTRVQDQVLIPEWLKRQFDGFSEVVVAVDGLGMSATGVVEIIDTIGRERTAIANVPDLLSPLWENRPAIPRTPIITLGTETVGWSRKQKIVWLRKWLKDNG
ncbi:MAG: aminopeptidase P family N-terminal domain-containing protein, partial [Bacteroidales bacterium]|nr:aminopeptidase P family N-terminal domain-containing protein [Bacteroidales bacterium]